MTKIKETIKAHPIITILILLIIVGLMAGNIFLYGKWEDSENYNKYIELKNNQLSACQLN